MGVDGRKSCFAKSNSWISDTIPIQTSALVTLPRKSPTPNELFNRNESDPTSVDENGSYRASTHNTKFCFSNIPCSEIGWCATSHIQSSKSEQVRVPREVPTCQHPKDSQLLTTLRLDGQDRFVKRLLPCACISSTQMFSQNNLSKQTISNDMSPLRTVIGSKSICIINKLGSTSTETKRCSPHRIFGRFSGGPPALRSTLQSCSNDRSPTFLPRVDSKFIKICTNTTEKLAISRCDVGSVHKRKVASGRQMPTVASQNYDNYQKEICQLKRNAVSDWPNEFCQFLCPQRSIKPQDPSVFLPKPSRQASPHAFLPSDGSAYRIKMVAGEPNPTFTNSPATCISSPDHRCLGHGLGCPVGQSEDVRHLVINREPLAFEPKRNVSYLQSITNPSKSTTALDSFSTIRQSNCTFLPTKRGRHEVASSSPIISTSIRPSRPIPHSSVSSLPTGQIQCGSRPPLTKEESSRVAPSAKVDTNNIPEMGTASNRLVCLPQSPCGTSLCEPRFTRQRSGIPRCSEPHVELPPSMGIPTPVFNSSSDDTSEQCKRTLSPRGSQMGKSFLAAGPPTASSCSSVHDSRPAGSINRHVNKPTSTEHSEHDIRNLEVWGWGEALKDWSPEQIHLLQSGWRVSSINAYKSAWRRWCSWAEEHVVSLSSPSGSDLARFLSDLYQKHNLSRNTILFHKSVVSTLCDPNKPVRLSSHPLVQQMLKAISIKMPKPEKPPIWDVDYLSSWLSNSFNENFNMYECSRRTACILLLCSGRRVHDLTLLEISSDHYCEQENSVTFWPCFGSKTDNADYRQSGWHLSSNLESPALDPVFWVKSLIKLSQSRRSTCKSNKLFITICGQPKAASKTTIANWIKSLLAEAGIKASPGSVRPAVASKNWIQSFSLDDILKRGNWRSPSTFHKFYNRAVINMSNEQSVSRLFTPV